MDTFAPLWPVIRFGMLLGGLLLPGAAVLRVLGLPRTLATCFAGSTLALYVTVLTLQLTGVRLSPVSLASGLAAVALIAGLMSRWLKQPGAESFAGGFFAPWRGLGGWLPFYALFWAAVLWRAAAEPLSGPDIEFRWGFLAEQMLRLGTLDFYPPRTAADFTAYFWVESIPPGVAALHAWAFACAGGSHLAWALPGVLLQLLALHELLWHVAHRQGGVKAARATVLAAAATPLLVWSVLIGQETGLTALALIGLGFALGRWQDTGHGGWAALAGIFAALGAAAREYGLVFPALGGLGLVFLGAHRRAWLAYTAGAAFALVWPLRVWLLTGNPFFSLDLGGLLPVNDRFRAWIGADAAVFGATLRSADGWRAVARYLLLFAPLAVVGWIALGIAVRRRIPGAAFAFTGTATALALWFVSVPYTNGGLFYSLRVASPALAVGTVAAGVALAAIARRSGPSARLTAVALGGLGLVLIPATLALPRNPWREPWPNWSAFNPPASLGVGTDDPTVALIVAARQTAGEAAPPASGPILADGPGYQRRFLPVGIPVVPLWSPQADWLFDRTLPPEEAVRRWRESGLRLLVVTKAQPHLDFFNAYSRWNQPPFQVFPVGETPATAVFAIRPVP